METILVINRGVKSNFLHPCFWEQTISDMRQSIPKMTQNADNRRFFFDIQ